MSEAGSPGPETGPPGAEAATLGGDELARELTAAVARKGERDALRRRLAEAERQFATADALVMSASRALTREGADVARLESLSIPRLLASLRGSRATELDAERAQQKRAEYAYAVALASRDAVATDRRLIIETLAATDGVDERQAAALGAMEAWLMAAPDPVRGRALVEAAQERGRLEALEAVTRQALSAGSQALELLSSARSKLSSAGDWATIDVFAGGGFLADSVKRSQMDDASRQLHAAEVALHRFTRELSDVGPLGEDLHLTLTMSVLDIVFDNVFTDLLVRDDTANSRTQADRAHEAVLAAVARLEKQLVIVRSARSALDERNRSRVIVQPIARPG